MRPALAAAAILLLAGCSGSDRRPAVAPPANDSGFGALAAGWRTDFSHTIVSPREFEAGGPGKDGIPAITHPRFVRPADVHFLGAREPVIELLHDGDARAYPLQILVWHEIVDDRVGGVPVGVTFCPLCNTAIAFDRRVGGKTLEFHVSGNLRNSDLVMYDTATESWWQQFSGQALVGRYAGTSLQQLPARIVSFADFTHAHPNGHVLSRETGFDRSYGDNPYPGYDDVSSPPYFATAHANDRRLPPKERVVLIERGGDSVAIPFGLLKRRKVVEVTVAGQSLTVRWRPGVVSPFGSGEVGSAQVLEQGRPVTFDEPFWFVVAAFRPHVVVIH